MRARVFASLDDFAPPREGWWRLGRTTANHFFFRALMRYGSFDEYHFFLRDEAQCRQFLTTQETLLESLSNGRRVSLFYRMDLPRMIREVDYTVFHLCDHVNHFNSLCRFRNTLGAAFPVTAFIHSISYKEQMTALLEMAMLGAGENDALLCSSVCGERVIRNCFERIASGLGLGKERLKTIVVPLGIDESEDKPDRVGARRRLKLDAEQVVALCLGRFSDFDKMDLFPLLQAFRRATDADNVRRLILAGAVHSEDYVEKTRRWAQAQGIGGAVTFVANPDEAKKADLFAAADFFVSISDNPQETFGLTLLEAMRYGLPLLVSDLNGYRELATDDVGIRVSTLWDNFDELAALHHRLCAQSLSVDIGELADALRQLFGDGELRRKLGRAARRRFDEKYSHEKIIATLERVWIELKENCVGAREPVADPLSPNLFETFSHYVTDFIRPDDSVRSTALAHRLLTEDMVYPLLTGMSEMVSAREVVDVLKAAGEAVTVESLCRSVESEHWRRRYLIMWMLKHELLELLRNP